MAIIKIRGQDVDVDVEEELRQFNWTRPRWTSDKLIAASPFRYDKTPSFFVNLDGEYAGAWGDSGFYDEDWKSGGFVKLLAFLRDETYEETTEYLLLNYGMPARSESLKLRLPKIRPPQRFEPLPETCITQAISPYLSSRGISAEAQQMAGVGYGKQKGFCAIPWRLPNGRLANVMYRATRGKVFFYERGGFPIRRLVWGIDITHRQQAKIAVICEAPIDALTWLSAGVAAIAVGGVNFTDWQADLIKRSPIETVILGADNDKAGAKLNELVKRKLRGHVRIGSVDYGDKKDANACGADVLKGLSFNYDGLLDRDIKV